MDQRQTIKNLKISEEFCRELENKGVNAYLCITHPEVIGCDESRKYYSRCNELAGYDYSICKHLVLRERKGQKRLYMLIVDDDTKVDLKTVKEQLQCSKLEFASDSDLSTKLDTYQGNVSVFNIEYDSNNEINLIIDENLLKSSLLAFHPKYNGKSLFISPDNLLKYLSCINKKVLFTKIPKQETQKDLVKVL